MQSKKLVKLAVIREDGETPCPYGLNIPDACKTAGNCITSMQLIDGPSISKDSKDETIEANKRILMLNSNKDKCKYANYIFENDKVECGCGDRGDGAGPISFRGTPTMTGYNGLLSVPPYERTLDFSSSFGLGGYFNSIAELESEYEELIKKATTEDDDK